MNELDWHDVLESITVGHRKWSHKRKAFVVRQCQPVPLPLESLNALENRTGFRLPRSYREFCRVFGGGELSDCYQILIPDAPHETYDIEKRNLLFHDSREYNAYSPDPEQYERGYIFAQDIGRGIYFWDPQEITDDRRNEYGIYGVFEGWETKRLADTFGEFIIDLCLGERHRELYDDQPKRFYSPYLNAT